MVATNKHKLKLFHILVCFLVVIGQIENAFAEMMQKGKTKTKFLANIYHQNSNDGAQVVDNSGREEANVLEPMIFIEHQITEHTAINASGVFDAWTAASDTRLDGLTGASGEEARTTQTRVSGTLGVRQEYGSTEWHSNIGFSTEYDYRSMNAAIGGSKGFAQDNFTLGVDLRYFADAVKVFQDITPANTAVMSDYLARQIVSVSLSASQILTVKDIISLSVDFVRATNNFESTASTVLVNGTRDVEDLPGTRSRYASTLKWVHGVGENGALHSSYRYYFDQWDIKANTYELSYFHALCDDQDMASVSLRYHDQTKAEFFARSFSASHQGYRTSDSDLEDFQSYEFSTSYAYGLGEKEILGVNFEDLVWDNGVTYATRTNGMRYGYLQSSFSFTF